MAAITLAASSATVALDEALGYLDLLAEQKPEKLERACVRWHGRLETEAPILTSRSRSAPWPRWRASAPGERDAIDVLRRLLRRVRPTLVPRVAP